MPKPLVIAHRGDSSRALENSLEAFRLALSIPADMIEFDVRRSRDNILYVMHDNRTARTCETDISIERSSSGDVSKVRLRNGEPVPILRDVLDLVAGRIGLNIEVKSEGAGALTAAHIAAVGYRGDILISSFKESEVLDARHATPQIPVAGIFDVFTPAEVKAYGTRGYTVISLNRKTVTRELVRSLHGQGVKIYVWTVDEEDEMRRFVEWEVDGIYSNRPVVLRQVVDAAR
jgi:glycerophosphoryl diester phosphodiesterase